MVAGYRALFVSSVHTSRDKDSGARVYKTASKSKSYSTPWKSTLPLPYIARLAHFRHGISLHTHTHTDLYWTTHCSLVWLTWHDPACGGEGDLRPILATWTFNVRHFRPFPACLPRCCCKASQGDQALLEIWQQGSKERLLFRTDRAAFKSLLDGSGAEERSLARQKRVQTSWLPRNLALSCLEKFPSAYAAILFLDWIVN